MGNFIENRPVSCNVCNNYPIYGREETYRMNKVTIQECRWVCSRCGNLVRVDENRLDDEKESN